MKSGNQRRKEIAARRKRLAVKRPARPSAVEFGAAPYRFVPVNESQLASNNSYGAPDFVRRGFYIDRAFRCVDCNKDAVWRASQQKWWYEIAKGFVYSTAIRCRLCRRKERERREEARRVHLEGLARKKKLG